MTSHIPPLNRVLGADLMVMAQHLMQVPNRDRVAHAAKMLEEVRTARATGEAYGASVTAAFYAAYSRGKPVTMNLLDEDCMNAWEAALIALRDFARQAEKVAA